LEETDTNIINWGHLANLSWWDPNNGVKHEGWNDGIIIEPAPPNQVTCISLQGSQEAYFVANGNPCTLGDAFPAGGVEGGSEVLTEPSPSSPLTPSSALAYGQNFVSRYGGGATPSSETVYAGTEASAMQAVQPDATIPADASSAATLTDPVYVDVMTGGFTLPYSPVPQGAKVPSGENLAVVFSATTGHVLNVALTPSQPNVSVLGTAVASKD